MFYLMMHSTHFIHSYMVSTASVGTKEGNVLFNDALNTFHSQFPGSVRVKSSQKRSLKEWKEGRKCFI